LSARSNTSLAQAFASEQTHALMDDNRANDKIFVTLDQ